MRLSNIALLVVFLSAFPITASAQRNALTSALDSPVKAEAESYNAGEVIVCSLALPASAALFGTDCDQVGTFITDEMFSPFRVFSFDENCSPISTWSTIGVVGLTVTGIGFPNAGGGTYWLCDPFGGATITEYTTGTGVATGTVLATPAGGTAWGSLVVDSNLGGEIMCINEMALDATTCIDAAAGGAFVCLYANSDNTGGGAFGNGTSDAAAPADCSGQTLLNASGTIGEGQVTRAGQYDCTGNDPACTDRWRIGQYSTFINGIAEFSASIGEVDLMFVDNVTSTVVHLSQPALGELVLELEPCGATSNDVCAANEPIPLPSRLIGQTHSTGGVPDVDWYRFDVASPRPVQVAVASPHAPLELRLIGPDCSGLIYAVAKTDISGNLALASYLPTAGSYLLRVAYDSTTVKPCDGNNEYFLNLASVGADCNRESGLRCAFDLNDGCDIGSIAQLDSIACGDARCGAVVDDSSDPSDWFTFDLTGSTMTEWGFLADFMFDLEIWAIGADCGSSSVVYALSGAAGTFGFDKWLTAGTYAVRVASATSGVLTCPSNVGEYQLTYAGCADNPVDPSITMQTVADGLWADPNTWNVGEIPGPANTVIVNHDVHMALDRPAPACEVRDLTVANGGNLHASLDNQLGAPMIVRADQITVEDGGAIQGGGGGSGSAGRVLLELPPDSTAAITNHGLIAGGAGGRGGEVVIQAPAGTLLNTATGEIHGGLPSGNLDLFADTVTNDGGLIATGAADSAYPKGGIFTIDAANESRNVNGGRIESDWLVPALGGGYRNFFTGFQRVEIDSTSVIDCGSTSGRWLCVNALDIQLAGTILAHQFCGDPPILTVSGDVYIEGDVIELAAADGVLVRNLNNAPAILAETSIAIKVAPGGIVDFRGLAAGTNWLQSNGSITIEADLVLTDSGTSLADLMSPTPTVLGGTFYNPLCLTPGNGEVVVTAGETLRRRMTVRNCGNGPIDLDVDITDSAGWLTQPFLLTGETLDPAQAVAIQAEIVVPVEAAAGFCTTVTLSSRPTAGGPLETVEIVFVVGSGDDAVAGCQGVDSVNVLSINGDTGQSPDHEVAVVWDDSFDFSIVKPAAGGGGKFVAHLNVGEPTAQTTSVLPAQLGASCFEFLFPAGAMPVAIWTNINKPTQIGVSNFFGQSVPNPGRAPTTFFAHPAGGLFKFPIGSAFTLQAVIINPDATSRKGASVTNAIVMKVVE